MHRPTVALMVGCRSKRLNELAAAMMWRRKLKLKATRESSSSCI